MPPLGSLGVGTAPAFLGPKLTGTVLSEMVLLVVMLFLTSHIPGGHRVWLALIGAAWIPGPHSHHDTSTTSDQWLMAKYGSVDPQSTLAPACGDLTRCPVSRELGSPESPSGAGQELQKKDSSGMTSPLWSPW